MKTTKSGSTMANSKIAAPFSSRTIRKYRGNSRLCILVFHPAFGIGCQDNLVQIERRERQVELERILKAHHSSALRQLGADWGIECYVPADRNIAVGRAGARRVRTQHWSGRTGIDDLGGIEIRGLHHGCDGCGHRYVGIVVTARSARQPCRSNRSLLRGLRNRRIDIEGATKPDDAE